PMGGNMTQDTGEFRIADLAPGRYWISAVYRRMSMFGEAPARNTADKPEEEYVTTYYPGVIDQAGARPVDVVAGQELPGVDIRLQKARVFRIRGKITGGAESARNLRVMLMPRDSMMMMMGFMGGAGGMVKEDGSFEIGGVQPGSYYVSAMANQGRPQPMGKVAVDVGRDNVENVALVLTGPLTLNGVIRIDGDVEQLEKAAGKKITFSSVRVQLMPLEGMNFANTGGQAKDDGTFTLENVGHDKFRVMAMGLPQGTWLKSIRAGEQEVLDKGLDLNAGSSGPLQITLGVGTGSVSGTVQDAKQKPVSASMVQLIPDPMKEERYDLIRVSSTDQNGQFTMQGIPPGEYKVFALDDVESGVSTDPEFLKTHDSKLTKVTVKENSQQSVSLTQISVETN
ncbi:MAG TPA: carboxypeptidase-like regulatory domain-containing protein, partial [Bryobacteraceae bacterium]|nr:carboxypeptidase-like regulatory domain-containing protein [Bryobacteraceae bacterium]